MTCDAPVLSISRLDASTVRLSWVAADPGDVSGYNLYRDTTPYFDPVGTPYQTFANPGATTFDDAVLGDPDTNYFYALRAVCAAGDLSEASGQVGKFEFELYETTGTDYTWITIPLVDPTLVMASDLATHIENNSSAAVEVISVSRWVAVNQGLEGYLHDFGWGDFAVTTLFPYSVEIDIPAVTSGSVIWALVGAVPAITYKTYTLVETTGTDYTWIMLPLELPDLVMASDLAAHIVNNSSAAVEVISVSRWVAVNQGLEGYLHDFGWGDFAIRFGYPYQIEVNVITGSSVTWPCVPSTGDIDTVPAEDRVDIVEES